MGTAEEGREGGRVWKGIFPPVRRDMERGCARPQIFIIILRMEMVHSGAFIRTLFI